MSRQPTSAAATRKNLTPAERKQRIDNENALRPKRVGKIICPTWLDDNAKLEFARIVKEMKTMGILTSIDIPSLAICCDAYSKWQIATEFVNKHGLLKVKESARGVKSIENNPAIKDALRYGELYRKMTVECGLTPNARLRMAVQKTPAGEGPDDALYKFLMNNS